MLLQFIEIYQFSGTKCFKRKLQGAEYSFEGLHVNWESHKTDIMCQQIEKTKKNIRQKLPKENM